MNKSLIRLFAFVLVPCLAADPVPVSAFSAAAPARVQHSTNSQIFNGQALSALSGFFERARLNRKPTVETHKEIIPSVWSVSKAPLSMVPWAGRKVLEFTRALGWRDEWAPVAVGIAETLFFGWLLMSFGNMHLIHHLPPDFFSGLNVPVDMTLPLNQICWLTTKRVFLSGILFVALRGDQTYFKWTTPETSGSGKGRRTLEEHRVDFERLRQEVFSRSLQLWSMYAAAYGIPVLFMLTQGQSSGRSELTGILISCAVQIVYNLFPRKSSENQDKPKKPDPTPRTAPAGQETQKGIALIAPAGLLLLLTAAIPAASILNSIPRWIITHAFELRLLAAATASFAYRTWSGRQLKYLINLSETYVGHEDSVYPKWMKWQMIGLSAIFTGGVFIYVLGDALAVQMSGAAVLALTSIVSAILFKGPKERPARPTSRPVNPLDQIRRDTIRDALRLHPDENILGVVLIEPNLPGGETMSEDALVVMLVKAEGESPLFMDHKDMEVFQLLEQQMPEVILNPVMPLILKGTQDKGTQASLDIAISMFFVPAHMMDGVKLYGAPQAGASIAKRYEVLARTPEEEQRITELIKSRIDWLSHGGKFGGTPGTGPGARTMNGGKTPSTGRREYTGLYITGARPVLEFEPNAKNVAQNRLARSSIIYGIFYQALHAAWNSKSRLARLLSRLLPFRRKIYIDTYDRRRGEAVAFLQPGRRLTLGISNELDLAVGNAMAQSAILHSGELTEDSVVASGVGPMAWPIVQVMALVFGHELGHLRFRKLPSWIPGALLIEQVDEFMRIRQDLRRYAMFRTDQRFEYLLHDTEGLQALRIHLEQLRTILPLKGLARWKAIWALAASARDNGPARTMTPKPSPPAAPEAEGSRVQRLRGLVNDMRHVIGPISRGLHYVHNQNWIAKGFRDSLEPGMDAMTKLSKAALEMSGAFTRHDNAYPQQIETKQRALEQAEEALRTLLESAKQFETSFPDILKAGSKLDPEPRKDFPHQVQQLRALLETVQLYLGPDLVNLIEEFDLPATIPEIQMRDEWGQVIYKHQAISTTKPLMIRANPFLLEPVLERLFGALQDAHVQGRWLPAELTLEYKPAAEAGRTAIVVGFPKTFDERQLRSAYYSVADHLKWAIGDYEYTQNLSFVVDAVQRMGGTVRLANDGDKGQIILEFPASQPVAPRNLQSGIAHIASTGILFLLAAIPAVILTGHGKTNLRPMARFFASPLTWEIAIGVVLLVWSAKYFMYLYHRFVSRRKANGKGRTIPGIEQFKRWEKKGTTLKVVVGENGSTHIGDIDLVEQDGTVSFDSSNSDEEIHFRIDELSDVQKISYFSPSELLPEKIQGYRFTRRFNRLLRKKTDPANAADIAQATAELVNVLFDFEGLYRPDGTRQIDKKLISSIQKSILEFLDYTSEDDVLFDLKVLRSRVEQARTLTAAHLNNPARDRNVYVDLDLFTLLRMEQVFPTVIADQAHLVALPPSPKLRLVEPVYDAATNTELLFFKIDDVQEAPTPPSIVLRREPTSGLHLVKKHTDEAENPADSGIPPRDTQSGIALIAPVGLLFLLVASVPAALWLAPHAGDSFIQLIRKLAHALTSPTVQTGLLGLGVAGVAVIQPDSPLTPGILGNVLRVIVTKTRENPNYTVDIKTLQELCAISKYAEARDALSGLIDLGLIQRTEADDDKKQKSVPHFLPDRLKGHLDDEEMWQELLGVPPFQRPRYSVPSSNLMADKAEVRRVLEKHSIEVPLILLRPSSRGVLAATALEWQSLLEQVASKKLSVSTAAEQLAVLYGPWTKEWFEITLEPVASGRLTVDQAWQDYAKRVPFLNGPILGSPILSEIPADQKDAELSLAALKAMTRMQPEDPEMEITGGFPNHLSAAATGRERIKKIQTGLIATFPKMGIYRSLHLAFMVVEGRIKKQQGSALPAAIGLLMLTTLGLVLLLLPLLAVPNIRESLMQHLPSLRHLFMGAPLFGLMALIKSGQPASPDDTAALWGAFWHQPKAARAEYSGKIGDLWKHVFMAASRERSDIAVLDVATGNFAIAKEAKRLLPQAQVHAVDIAAHSEDQIPAGIQFRQCPIEKLYADDASFDLVVGMHGLEYSALERSLPELMRVMRPGARGVFILHGPDDIHVVRAKKLLSQNEILNHLQVVGRIQEWLTKSHPSDAPEKLIKPLEEEIDRREKGHQDSSHLVWTLGMLREVLEQEQHFGEESALKMFQYWLDYLNILVPLAQRTVSAAAKIPDAQTMESLLTTYGFHVDLVEPFKAEAGLEGWLVEVRKPSASKRGPAFLRQAA